VDFGVRPRDKTPKSEVAHCKLSPSQESENEQIQNQIDAHLFFLTIRGSSTRNLCHKDKLSIKLFIGKPLKDSGKGWHVCNQALYALGCCTTTTPHVTRQSPSMNFWQKKAFLWFFLFPRLKNHLTGRHFGTLDNIQKSVTDELKGIPAETFQHCYEQWKQCLRRCVAAQGNCFERDILDL